VWAALQQYWFSLLNIAKFVIAKYLTKNCNLLHQNQYFIFKNQTKCLIKTPALVNTWLVSIIEFLLCWVMDIEGPSCVSGLREEIPTLPLNCALVRDIVEILLEELGRIKSWEQLQVRNGTSLCCVGA
jgi:hypothetical protein